MKTAIILASSLVLLSSCDNGMEQKKQQDKAISEMNSFVDSVENLVATNATLDWNEVDRRYEKLENNTEVAFENASEEMEADAERLGDKYDSVKNNFKDRQAELNMKADAQIAEVESWFERTSDKAGVKLNEAGEDVEDGYKESMNWLEENYKMLEENTQKKVDELKEKLNKDEA